MFTMSSLLSNELDVLDRSILLLVMKIQNPSSYAIWAAMNKQMQGEGLAYTNIKKRVRRMISMGLLQRIEPVAGTSSIRGRKEYRLNMAAMERLSTSLLTNPEDAKTIVEYINKSGLDIKAFKSLLLSNFTEVLNFMESFYKSINETLTLQSSPSSNIRMMEAPLMMKKNKPFELSPQQIEAMMKSGVPRLNVEELIDEMLRQNMSIKDMQETLKPLRIKQTQKQIEELIKYRKLRRQQQQTVEDKIIIKS